MQLFIEELKKRVTSEVRVDSVSKALYSVDASIYEVQPLAIIIPRTKEDLIQAIKIAHKHKVPIIPRGAATGITGGCLGEGLVIDTSKYLHQILSINYEQEYAIVQPGVVQDTLNAALEKRGYRLGPDTSTGNRATIGGMVGNNAVGAHSLKYGHMCDHVEAIELILADGSILNFHPCTQKDWEEKCSLNSVEGHIYKTIDSIEKEYKNDIEKDFPKVKRRSSGYNLNELSTHNLAKLITGSEGSLGFVTEVKLRICKRPSHQALVLLAVDDMLKAIKDVPHYLSTTPFALEMIDEKIIQMGSSCPSMKGKLSWLESTPAAIIVAEFEAETEDALEVKCKEFHSRFSGQSYIFWSKIINDKELQKEVWELRKSGLGLLLSKRSYSRAIAFIEDIAVPASHLYDFMNRFITYLQAQNKEAGIYGHIGDGCLHIRPYIDLRQEDELALMQKIMTDTAKLVKEAGGTLSAEHGDGLIRSWMNPDFFGKRLFEAFTKIKHAFDPDNLMNPGKIIPTTALTENLRLSPKTVIKSVPTFFDYSREGGFELAVDLCNGNGLCRKKENIMCPSFQVSCDEKDSTRARANALRAATHGKIEHEELFSKEFYDVMDLCIQCKGCKTECPSQVDMAKMKAEYLYAYHKERGVPLRSYLFGYIGNFYRIGAFFPSISNALLKIKPFKWLLTLFGITDKRQLPLLAKRRFSQEVQKRERAVSSKKIVLFNDTFTEFLSPSIGSASVTILERLGYEVIVPEWHCCGRTLISKGLLPEAKSKAEALLNILYPYAKGHIVICGIEPSCLLTIRDEWRDLHLDKEKIDAVVSMSKTLDEVLYDDLELLAPQLRPLNAHILVHGHCHQKALCGMQKTLAILKSIPGASCEEIPSGCCGMAGSFGYEKEHEAFSKAIGELVLFPYIRSHKEAIIIASGTSCRSQIMDGCAVKAYHLAELLQQQLKPSTNSLKSNS